MTGRDYGSLDFTDYCRSRDLEDFIKEAARLAYPRIPDFTCDEFVEIVRGLQALDPETDINVPR